MQDTCIVLVDEEKARKAEAARQKTLAMRRTGGGSNADPFAGPSRPSRSFSAPGKARDRITGTDRPFNTESYDHFGDNPFFSSRQEPLSTLSVDVDTASYSNIRRMIHHRTRIPLDAARIEVFINY